MTKIEQEVLEQAKLWVQAYKAKTQVGSPYDVTPTHPTYGDRRAVADRYAKASDALWTALLKLENLK